MAKATCATGRAAKGTPLPTPSPAVPRGRHLYVAAVPWQSGVSRGPFPRPPPFRCHCQQPRYGTYGTTRRPRNAILKASSSEPRQ